MSCVYLANADEVVVSAHGMDVVVVSVGPGGVAAVDVVTASFSP